MLKVSRLADYAVIIMCALAEHQEHCSASDIAALTQVAKTTVSKILKILGKHGLIQAVRGANGGYTLLNPAKDISLAAVVAAVDGPIALTECSTAKQSCSKLACCGVRSNWQFINTIVEDVLSHYSLADMMRPMKKHSITEAGVRFKPTINIKVVNTHEH